MSFNEKLAAAVARNDSRLCVGLDPDPARIAGGVGGVSAFNRGIIEATADIVCCYKPNMGFYEALGQAGWDALRATLAAVPRDVPVLLDAKRGDIASTAVGYARAVFEVLGADAVTVSPYLGGDSLEPFFRYRDRGVFVLCHTSNDGAGDMQDLPVVTLSGGTQPLYLAVASRALGWNVHGNAGLVVGATYPLELALVRERCPDLPILVPGVGAQAGALEESARAADNGTTYGFLINASRGVTYAAKAGEDPFRAARAAALGLRDAINQALRPAAAQAIG
jgi:orotidine-5'-phosphate decarboxylase